MVKNQAWVSRITCIVALKYSRADMVKSCSVHDGMIGMDNGVEIISGSVGRTRRLGAALGEQARAGDVILLVGELGAGKTCLAQGIAEGLGIEDCVTSPSFVLLREYRGRLPLYHIDFYRLDTIEEVVLLGLDDYLCGEGVCVVEWADRGMDALPGDHLLIEMESLSATRRRLVFHPTGHRYIEMLAQLERSGIVVRNKRYVRFIWIGDNR